MFKKRTNFRKKADARQDDEEDEGDAPGIMSVDIPSGKLKKGGTSAKGGKPKKGGAVGGGTTASAALLSFEDEEADAEVFQVKKKSVNKKKSMRAPDASMAVGTSETNSSGAKGGDYSLESLRELASKQKGFGARPAEHMDPNAPVEIKMRGTLKPPGVGHAMYAPHTTRGQMRDDDQFLPPPPPRLKDDVTAAVEKDAAEIAIPDAAAITAAKAKREQMRAASSSAPEFIPISGSEHHVDFAVRSGGGGEARGGARESDDDEVEENVRVKFGVGDEEITRGSKGAAGVFSSMMTTMVEDNEDTRSWEDEQLRKIMGVGGSAAAAKAAKDKAAAGRVRAGAFGVSGGSVNVAKAKRGPSASRNDMTAGGERALTSLRAGLARADAAWRGALNELKRADESSASADAALETHEERLAVAGERYKYVQELRDYFRDLCECLKDKLPIIEELEEHIQRLHEQRSTAAAVLADGDDDDEQAEAEAAVEAAQSALMVGTSAEDAVVAATAAVENVVATRLSGGSSELDEFGRDINLAKKRAAEKRAVTRRARRAKEEEEEEKKTGVSPRMLPGEADDAEDPEEVGLFVKGWEDAQEAASCVMRDAATEFASITPVKTKSEEWKRKFPKTYRDAYMSASTPRLFAPFVRLELITWSPLHTAKPPSMTTQEQAAPPIDGMSWYSELFDYGMSAAQVDDGDVDGDDTDANLVPTLIEKLVAPVVDHAARECWDPSSVEQSRRLAGVVKEMLVYLEPAECGAIGDLLIVVKNKLRQMVDKRCGVPAWAPVVTALAPAAAYYVRRRLGVTLRCARSVVSWDDVLPSGEIKMLVCDGIISQHVAPHLRLLLAQPGECLHGIERTLDAVGPGWLRGGGSSSSDVSPVRSVASTLAQLVRSNPEAHNETMSKDDASGKGADPRRLIRVLTSLGDLHEAQAVAQLFGIL